VDQFSNYTPSCAKRFKYLAEKMTALQPTVSLSADDSVHQLSQYVTEVQSPTFLSASAAVTALAYWKSRQTLYYKLAPVAVTYWPHQLHKLTWRDFSRSAAFCHLGAETA